MKLGRPNHDPYCNVLMKSQSADDQVGSVKKWDCFS